MTVTLPTQVQLDLLLATLDQRVEYTLNATQKVRMLNLAGDLCFDAGQPERALTYYERALHALLAVEHYESAANLCKKIVALTPEAIRAHSTLAWLAMVRGMLTEARNHILQYTRAAEATGLTDVARSELTQLAERSQAAAMLECIAEALLDLNDSQGADAVFGRMLAVNGVTCDESDV